MKKRLLMKGLAVFISFLLLAGSMDFTVLAQESENTGFITPEEWVADIVEIDEYGNPISVVMEGEEISNIAEDEGAEVNLGDPLYVDGNRETMGESFEGENPSSVDAEENEADDSSVGEDEDGSEAADLEGGSENVGETEGASENTEAGDNEGLDGSEGENVGARDEAVDENADDEAGEETVDEAANEPAEIETLEMIDTDGDGEPDTVILPIDEEIELVDIDEDGIADSYIVDENEDGIPDYFIVDSDGDGIADSYAVDTDEDGIPDSLVEVVVVTISPKAPEDEDPSEISIEDEEISEGFLDESDEADDGDTSLGTEDDETELGEGEEGEVNDEGENSDEENDEADLPQYDMIDIDSDGIPDIYFVDTDGDGIADSYFDADGLPTELPPDVIFDENQVVDGVKVSVFADEGVFPQGAYMVVTPIYGEKSEEIDLAIDETIESADKEECKSYVWDITIYNAKGNEIQPRTEKGSVYVSFDVEEAGDDFLETQVYHISESEEAEGQYDIQPCPIAYEAEGEILIETDGFSYYVIKIRYSSLTYTGAVDQSNNVILVSDIVAAVGISSAARPLTVVSASDNGNNTEIVTAQNATSSEWEVTILAPLSQLTTLSVQMSDGITYSVNLSITVDSTPILHIHNAYVPSGATTICNVFEKEITSLQDLLDIVNPSINPAGTYNIYLSADINMISELVIPYGYNINLCLNGYAIRQTGFNARVIYNNGTLAIYDCASNTGKITGGNTDSSGAGIYNNGTLYLYGGSITGNTYSTTIAATRTGGGGIFNASSKNFYMYGGQLTYNTVTAPATNSNPNGGGGLYSQGKVYIYGGLIAYNTANGDGGGIFIDPTGYINASNVTISNNTANTVLNSSLHNYHGKGGGLHIEGTSANSSNRLVGVRITNNTAAEGAGLYFSSNNGATISDSIISDNSASVSGGGISTADSLTITDTTISSNTSPRGAGLYSNVEKTGGVSLTLNKSVIKDNWADGSILGNANGGGIFFVSKNSTLTLNACTVSGNKANNCIDPKGAGIYMGSQISNLYIYGGKISENEVASSNSGSYGAGIYLAGSSTMLIAKDTDGNGTIINKNVVSGSGNATGAGIYISTGTNATIYGATITENEVRSSGGAAYGAAIHAATSFFLRESTVNNNAAYAASKHYTNSGSAIYILNGANFENVEVTGNTYSGPATGVPESAVYLFSQSTNNVLHVAGKIIIKNNTDAANGGRMADLGIMNHNGYTSTVAVDGALTNSEIHFNLYGMNASYSVAEITGKITSGYDVNAYGYVNGSALANDFFIYEGDTNVRKELLKNGEVYVLEGHIHNCAVPNGATQICNLFDMVINSEADLKSITTSGPGSYNIYLDKNIDLTSSWTIPSGYNINLCLNGYALQMYGNGSVIENNGVLSIYDCDNSYSNTTNTGITHQVTRSGNQYSVIVSNAATSYAGPGDSVSGGIITGGKSSASTMNCGGGIDNHATLHLYGGTICGNNITKPGMTHSAGATAGAKGNGGGGICNEKGAAFYMYGGTVSFNSVTDVLNEDAINFTAYSGGGGIFNWGIFKGFGGIVERNIAENTGGGIVTGIAQGSTFADISGMIIRDNEAIYDASSGRMSSGVGGGVSSLSGTLTIADSQIYGNVAAFGAGIGDPYPGVGNLTITSCDIHDNTAERQGGAVYVYGDNFDISGSKIFANAVSGANGADGGAICQQKGNGGQGSITDCYIYDNYATTTSNSQPAKGGAIFSDEPLTINNVQFDNNKVQADYAYGGAIYTHSMLNIGTISGCSFTGNECNGNLRACGGAILGAFHGTPATYATLNINQSSITGNKVTSFNGTAAGAGIHSYSGVSCSVANSSINGNTAHSDYSPSVNASAAGISAGGYLSLSNTSLQDNVVECPNTVGNSSYQGANGIALRVSNASAVLENVTITGNYFVGSESFNSCAVLVALNSASLTFSVNGFIKIRGNYNKSNRDYFNANPANPAYANLGEGNLYLLKEGTSASLNPQWVYVTGALDPSSYVGYNLYLINTNLSSERTGQVTKNYIANAYGAGGSATNANPDDFFHYEGSAGTEVILNDEVYIANWHTHNCQAPANATSSYVFTFENEITSVADLQALINATVVSPKTVNAFLTADLTLSDTITIPALYTVNLCLNGHKIVQNTSEKNAFLNQGVLNIYDCDTRAGAADYIKTLSHGGNSYNVVGGIITGASGVGFGGAVSNASSATFSLYGGTLTGNTATTAGGAIYNSMGTVNIFDGAISHNTVTSASGVQNGVYGGAGIMNRGGTLNIYGGSFEENKVNRIGTSQYIGGGAICSESTTYAINARMNIYGGVFKNNTSALSGGAIYSSDTNTHIENATFIGNSSANGDGGAAYHERGSFDITDCVLTQNHADTYGGAIAFQHSQGYVVKVGSGNVFTDNSARHSGGAISIGYADVTIEESVFTGNIATTGGAVYIAAVITTPQSTKYVTIEECEFDDNYASGDGLKTNSAIGGTSALGGAIHSGEYVTLNIIDTDITNNKAINASEAKGAGIYSSSDLTITSTTGAKGKITGNEIWAVTNATATSPTAGGGGVYLYTAVSNHSINVDITGVTFASNSVNSSSYQAYGGALYAHSQVTANLKDCIITDNEVKTDGVYAMAYGGGIVNRGRLTFEGGSISHNRAKEENATTDFTSVGGSGIYSTGEISLKDTSITDNEFFGQNYLTTMQSSGSSQYFGGAGVYVSSDTYSPIVRIEGVVKIKDNINHYTAEEANLYLVTQNYGAPNEKRPLVYVMGQLYYGTADSDIKYDLWSYSSGKYQEIPGQVTIDYSNNAYAPSRLPNKAVNDFFDYQGHNVYQLINTDGEVWVVTHVHDWRYIAEDNIMYAYCVGADTNNECANTGTASGYKQNALKIVLNAPNMIYNGSAYNLAEHTTTDTILPALGGSKSAITYYNCTSYNAQQPQLNTYSSTPMIVNPKAPGYYLAKFTYTPADSNVSYTCQAEFEIIDDGYPIGSITLYEYGGGLSGAIASWNNFAGFNTITRAYDSAKKVVIEGTDIATGICYVDYIISDTVITNTDLATRNDWIRYGNSTNIILNQNSRLYVYAKLTDPSGHATYIDSEGIAIYTQDSAVDTQKVYTYGSNVSIPYQLLSDENVISDVLLRDTSVVPAIVTTLTDGVDYDIAYGTGADAGKATLTIKNALTSNLNLGEYELVVSGGPADLPPRGDAFYNNPAFVSRQNDEPKTVVLKLGVEEAAIRLYEGKSGAGAGAPGNMIAMWTDALDKTNGGNDPFTIFHKSAEHFEIYRPDEENCLMQYCLSDTPLYLGAANPAQDITGYGIQWETYDNGSSISLAGVDIDPKEQTYFYAKLIYAGGIVFIGSEGVVLYNDAEQVTHTITHTVTEDTDKEAYIQPNGQDIDTVLLDGVPVTDGVDFIYLPHSDKFVFAADYLDNLTTGTHAIEIIYLTNGVTYYDDSAEVAAGSHLVANEAPVGTSFLIVVKEPTWEHNYATRTDPDNKILDYQPKADGVDDGNVKDLLLAKLEEAERNSQTLAAITAIYAGEEAGRNDGADVDAKLVLEIKSAEQVYTESELSTYRTITYGYMIDQILASEEAAEAARLAAGLPDPSEVVIRTSLEGEQIPKTREQRMYDLMSEVPIGAWFDISLYLTYNISNKKTSLVSQHREKITDISDEGLRTLGAGKGFAENITLTIPENMRDSNTTGDRKFSLARLHEMSDGTYAIEFLPITYEDGILSFTTSLFSLYIVMYEDEGIPYAPVVPVQQEILLQFEEEGKKHDYVLDAPITGDTNTLRLRIAAVIASISGMFLIFLALFSRKKDKEEENKR